MKQCGHSHRLADIVGNAVLRKLGSVSFIVATWLLSSASASAQLAKEKEQPSLDKPPYDLTWRVTDDVWLRPFGFAQLRWTGNYREQPDGGDTWTSAFTVPRARVHLEGGVTEYMSFMLRVGALSNGDVSFEQAYADAHLGRVTLRAGQFNLPLIAEEQTRPDRLQATDFSQSGNTFASGQVAGVGAIYDADWLRAHVYTTNGLRTGFAEVQGPLNARYAFMTRLEALALGNRQNWKRFDDRSSFRGSDFAVRVGLSGHYQKMPESFNQPNAQLAMLAADVTLEGDGWNVFGNAVWAHTEAPSASDLDAAGIFLQAGVFIIDRLEIFVAYDAVLTDGAPVPTNPSATPTTDYHSVLAGTNFYLTPHEHRAKLQLDGVWALDPIATSLVDTASNTGLLATTEGGQAAMRLQLVIGF